MSGFASARLEIDLDAIAANWHALHRFHPSGPVAAVLKADGYGLGAGPIAARLVAEGCRHYFVATMDEAVALRRVVPASRHATAAGRVAETVGDTDAPPLPDRPGERPDESTPGARALLATLNGLPGGAAADFVAHEIVPALGSLGEVAEWAAQARRLGRRLPALLHVDSGMSRLGLPPREVDALADDPSILDGIEIRFVMSHLASSERQGDPMNEAQRRRFDAACVRLPPAPRCLGNSGGIFLGPRFGTGLARAGGALYGVNPAPGGPDPLQSAVRLLAKVLQIREIESGDSVGYNAAWRACRRSRIATVGVGYADGWPRALSNAGVACFDGRMLPLVGRVSMDLSTYDATEAPSLRPGDRLELIGPNCPVEAVAVAAGTIPYEILTSLGQRYERVYRG